MLTRHEDGSFNPELNIKRDLLMEDMLRWVGYPSPAFRLRSVVGSAGSGKSWFMGDLKATIESMPDAPIIWWLDLGENFDNSNTESPANHIIRWKTSEVWRLDFLQPDESQWVKFLKMACEEADKIIFLIDSFDEISGSSRRWFEEHVLATAIEQPCVRVVLTRRDEYRITHPLVRWCDEVKSLEPFTTQQRLDQVERLYHVEQPSSLNLEEVRAAIEALLVEHPFINALFFKKYIENMHLGQREVRECLNIILQRTRITSSYSLELLEALTNKLPPVWTDANLSDRLGIKVDNLRLAPLFAEGVIQHVSGTAKYKTDHGIHALYQILRRLEG